MADVVTTLARAVSPLDLGRRWLLALGGPLAGRLARDRALRVTVVASASIALAFAGTALAPLWLLALGPIVLGVPHLLGDVRYLVVRPGLATRSAAMLLPLAALLVAGYTARASWGLGVAAAAVVVARGSATRKAAALAVLVPGIGLAHAFYGVGELLLAHLHNAVALALWWTWRPRDARHALLPLALFAALATAIAAGALDAPKLAWSTSGLGTSFRTHLAELAPRSAGVWGPRLVLLFAFAQSVHYAVWLRLVPEDDRPRPAPRPFASSVRALAADVGGVGLAITAALALGLAVWAAFSLREARVGFLRFSAFHGYLELGAIALAFVERRRPGERLAPGAEEGVAA